jgi:hypothetical protein
VIGNNGDSRQATWVAILGNMMTIGNHMGAMATGVLVVGAMVTEGV